MINEMSRLDNPEARDALNYVKESIEDLEKVFSQISRNKGCCGAKEFFRASENRNLLMDARAE